MAISEIDALKMIDETISSLDQSARLRVLAWINAKYNSGDTQTSLTDSAKGGNPQKVAKVPKPKVTRSRSSSKPLALKQLKELRFNPDGKKTFTQFVAEKKPTSQKQKCTVAIYYMSNEMGIANVTPNHVYTAFKAASWPIPKNLMNTMHQAGTEGWLDTEDSTSIKVTHIGENLVEHNLPKES